MLEFLSRAKQTNASALDFNYSSLLQSVVVVALSAFIWSILRNRRTLHGVSSLGEVRGPRSRSWFTGHHSQIFNLSQGWEYQRMLADEYGSAVQIKGILGRKEFYTFDPKALYHILVKVFVISGALLFGNGLLSELTVEQHRKQRKMLNPVFSIAHMRSMIQDGPREIDLLGWMARTALELIGQSGFGYSFDSMMDDGPRHKYSVAIKDLVPALTRSEFARTYLLPLPLKILPTNIRTCIMNLIPWKVLHDVRDMVNYMHELSEEIYEEKKCAFEEGDEAVLRQIGKGNDLLSIMMKENMKADIEDKLDEAEIIGQLTTFTFAAMDTTSNALSRILHLLTFHPEVQDKMRNETVAARRECEGDQLSYDELVGLPYLYAPVSTLIRDCTADTIVPLSLPVRSINGNEVTEIFIPKGTLVVISILNANRDPELWGPDVLEWKPERWLSPLPEAIMNSKMPGVYSHLMTFNGGNHSCIGFKFSQLEMTSPNKEIFWQMSGISSPIVVEGDDSRHPQLPLVVELAKGDHQ
ncbi:cytochrome P450 [Lentinula aciculospora]|uniref:Cytochrome P450 n=1 Tax=Lentinula aciculospora TaxID=153920 RepID=A0A9W9AG49_9AGAR|nr:cytochrome P450 [Lentinula aciculospora]